MGSQNKWLVVMGRRSAKLFSISDDGTSLKWFKTLRNPLGGERNRVMRKDRPGLNPGRYAKSVGTHALTGGKNPHEEVAVSFAKTVSHFLKHSSDEKEVDEITVAAESHMMGLMKKSIHNEKLNHIDLHWVGKDLCNLSNEKIAKIVLVPQAKPDYI